jgi:DNA-binding CsgD family transcriptional regulator
MRPVSTFFLLLSLFSGWPVVGQSVGSDFASGRLPDTVLGSFGGKYPPSPDSAEAEVWRLLTKAEQSDRQNDYMGLLDNLQRALALEAYAQPNSVAVFEVNRRMGYQAIALSPRYAMFFLKKACAISKALSDTGRAGTFQLAGQIAGLHLELGEPDSARHWHRQAILEAHTRLSHIAQASSLNNLGFFYSKTGRPDSAMFYYEAALRTLSRSGRADKILLCSIRDNIAQEHERTGRYAAALDIYRSNDTVFSQRNRWQRILPNRFRQIQVRKKMGGAGVDEGIEALRVLVQEHRGEMPDDQVLAFYEFSKNHFLQTGELRAVRRYDQVCALEKKRLDSKNKEKTDLIVGAFLNVQAVGFRREMEVHRLEAAAARQSLRTARLLSLLLFLIGSAAAAALVWFKRRRQREMDLAHRLTMAELRAKELEAQAMAQALELQKRDITNVALHNTQVLDNTRRMVGRLTEIARQKENTEQAIHALMVELQSQEQLGSRAQAVQENIDRVHAEFYQTLKNRFPALTKSEVELCGYLRVNLSNKDISGLKNIAPASVKMSKNRLRKKLSIGAEEDLYAFIQEV